jgi:hypothetical protein
MMKQGDVALLEDPVAQEMLQAPFPARMAYVWSDGTPRVIPIWFHWDGTDVVVTSPPEAPKLKAIADGTKVALTIDSNDWPNKVLLIRGPVATDRIDGIVPEYAAAARRCMGVQGGNAFLDMARNFVKESVRIRVRPEWVGLIDFQTRFPSAIAKSMGG